MVRPIRSMRPRFWRKLGRISSSWRVSTTFTMFNPMPWAFSAAWVRSLCALRPRDKSSGLTKLTSLISEIQSHVFELVLCVSLDSRLCIAISKLSLFIYLLWFYKTSWWRYKPWVKAKGDEYLYPISKSSWKHQMFTLVVQVYLIVSENWFKM